MYNQCFLIKDKKGEERLVSYSVFSFRKGNRTYVTFGISYRCPKDSPEKEEKNNHTSLGIYMKADPHFISDQRAIAAVFKNIKHGGCYGVKGSWYERTFNTVSYAKKVFDVEKRIFDTLRILVESSTERSVDAITEKIKTSISGNHNQPNVNLVSKLVFERR